MPEQILSPLNAASSYQDAESVQLPELPPSPVDPSTKWSQFAAAALAPTKGGHFSESLSNALGAQAAQQDKDAELQARYIPILYDARMKRAAAQQQQRAKQQEQLQAWGTAMTGGMASLLDKPVITKQDAMMVAQAAVQQGRAPAKFAQDYVAQLPDDPAELTAYIRRAALQATDPFRHVAAPKFEKMGEGDRGLMIGPGGSAQPIVEGKAPVGKPTELARLRAEQAALDPSDVQGHKDYAAKILKLTTHQPPNQFIVNPEKTLLDAFGEAEGKAYSDARQAALGAQNSMDTIFRLKDALGTGKVMAGPGTKFPMVALQIGSVMGMTGPNNNAIIANTRQALQAASQLELDASSQMKGQGAITENERKLLQKTSATLDDMTVEELSQVAQILEDRGRSRIRKYNSVAQRMYKLKNRVTGELIFKDTPIELLTVEEPSPYSQREVPTFNKKNQRVIRLDSQGNELK
jgi:hypothetical protein